MGAVQLRCWSCAPASDPQACTLHEAGLEKAGFAGTAGWWVRIGAGDILKSETDALAPEQGADGLEIAGGTVSLQPQGVLGTDTCHYLAGEGFTGTTPPAF